MAKGLKTYEKYSVKEDRSGNLMREKDGKPVLYEKINEVRLDEMTVTLLNNNWENFKEYFVLVEEKQVKQEKPVEVKETVVAVVNLPEPFDPEKFVKTAKKEQFLELSETDLESAFALMSKKQVMVMFDVEVEEKDFGKTTKAEFVDMAKVKINELKSK